MYYNINFSRSYPRVVVYNFDSQESVPEESEVAERNFPPTNQKFKSLKDVLKYYIKTQPHNTLHVGGIFADDPEYDGNINANGRQRLRRSKKR